MGGGRKKSSHFPVASSGKRSAISWNEVKSGIDSILGCHVSPREN